MTERERFNRCLDRAWFALRQKAEWRRVLSPYVDTQSPFAEHVKRELLKGYVLRVS